MWFVPQLLQRISPLFPSVLCEMSKNYNGLDNKMLEIITINKIISYYEEILHDLSQTCKHRGFFKEKQQ